MNLPLNCPQWLVAAILDSKGLLHLPKAYYMPGLTVSALPHLSLRTSLGVGAIIKPILQISKLRYRKLN